MNKVIRINQVCWVEHLPSWALPKLTMHLIDQTPQKDEDGNNIVGGRKYDKPAYWLTDNGDVFLAGLFPEFQQEAQRNDYSFVFEDMRDPNPMKLEPVYENLTADLRYKQADVLQALIKHDKGIVKCTTGFGKSFIIKMICLLYPTARIVVVSAARLVVDQLYKDISATCGKAAVGKCSSGTPSTEELKRIVVATNKSIKRAPLSECDILLFDEVHNVGDNQVFADLVENVGNARMYGFTASLARGDGALGLIKGLFGSVIAECTYQEAQAHKMVTPIRAMMPKYPHNPLTKLTDIVAINEKIHYWQNWQRNAFIAQIAADTPPDAQTVITVKTLEHAIFLKKCPELADWPIIHAGTVQKGKEVLEVFTLETAPERLDCVRNADQAPVTLVVFPGDSSRPPGYFDGDSYKSFYEVRASYTLPNGKPAGNLVTRPHMIAGVDASLFAMKKKEVNELVNGFASGDIKKAIATTVIKEGVNLNHLRVLIRADGATSEVINTQVPGRLSRLQEGKDYTLLIDPWDDDNPWVLGRSKARYRYYKQNGWTVWDGEKS